MSTPEKILNILLMAWVVFFFHHPVKFVKAKSENGGKDGHKPKPAAK